MGAWPAATRSQWNAKRSHAVNGFCTPRNKKRMKIEKMREREREKEAIYSQGYSSMWNNITITLWGLGQVIDNANEIINFYTIYATA